MAVWNITHKIDDCRLVATWKCNGSCTNHTVSWTAYNLLHLNIGTSHCHVKPEGIQSVWVVDRGPIRLFFMGRRHLTARYFYKTIWKTNAKTQGIWFVNGGVVHISLINRINWWKKVILVRNWWFNGPLPNPMVYHHFPHKPCSFGGELSLSDAPIYTIYTYNIYI